MYTLIIIKQILCNRNYLKKQNLGARETLHFLPVNSNPLTLPTLTMMATILLLLIKVLLNI
jgi:hypothetical protein